MPAQIWPTVKDGSGAGSEATGKPGRHEVGRGVAREWRSGEAGDFSLPAKVYPESRKGGEIPGI